MYKKYLLLIFAIFVAALFQTSFMYELFGRINPNIVLAFVFAYLYTNNTESALFTGFAGGIALDLMTSNIIGLSSLIFVGVTFLAFLVRKYAINNFFSQSLMCAAASLIYILITNWQKHPQFSSVLVSSVLTLITSFLIYFLIYRFGNERKPF